LMSPTRRTALLLGLGDGHGDDGGDASAARGDVGDLASDGGVVEYVGEVGSQLSDALLVGHGHDGTSATTRVHW
jgi:hypothetical protein